MFSIPTMSDAKSLIVDGSWTGGDGIVYTYGKVQKRRCRDCRNDFDWDGTPFKTRCTKCYGKIARKCETCKTNNVRADAAKGIVDCTSCWLRKREETHKVCPRCPPERSQHLRCPFNKVCCSDCESRAIQVSPPLTPKPESSPDSDCEQE